MDIASYLLGRGQGGSGGGGGGVTGPLTCAIIKNFTDYSDYVPANNSLSALESNLAESFGTAENLIVDHSGIVYSFGRTTEKATDEKAFTAWCKAQNAWFIPVFIGKTETSVEFSTMYGTTNFGTITAEGTVEYNGETYYYAANCPGSMQNPTVTYDGVDRAYIGSYSEASTTSAFKEKAVNFLLALVSATGATLE